MKEFLIVIGACVAVTATVIIGTRLSTDAIGIIVGAFCTSIPLSSILLVVIWALMRERRQGKQETGQQTPAPNVYVFGANGQPQLPGMQPPPVYGSLPAPRRDYRVVPEDAEWEDVN